MKTAFKPDANTTVTVVKVFHTGDDLNLNGTKTGNVAANDLCMVKLLIGPGNPGPASAPSTSSGIGIEIWLPSPANWNGRIHNVGGSGFDGEPAISSLTQVYAGTAAEIAGTEGAVAATTDTGHVASNLVAGGILDGSFGMNPDGSINTTLWTDFSSRSVHEMSLKTKAIAAAYYAKPATFAYFDGCSTGGRQGLKEAQMFPDDYDGILAGSSAINQSQFEPGLVYPELVVQRDLSGVQMTDDQLALVSAAAVSACDSTLNGQHDGYVSDPASCHYDPTKDPTVLCTSSGGANTSAACVSSAQALAFNKTWFGQTSDGSAPDPAVSNGYSNQLASNQQWFGMTRGTNLNVGPGFGAMGAVNGVATPFPVATDQVAIQLGDASISTPAFHNATGNGTNGWTSLSYAQLANASKRGILLQAALGGIDTTNPDLTQFQARKGKLIIYHGLSDYLIAPQSTNRYYDSVLSTMGGAATVQTFARYFQIPGMGHCSGVGSVNGVAGVSPAANPPLPANQQLYSNLTAWVESGIAPSSVIVKTTDGKVTRPLCQYPAKLTYVSGDRSSATSYSCN
ncbi:feruloyl esterase [Burkholderia sp. GAS332]|nr:feruloyl esterase [Burkholderia sp. GAS332]